MLTDKRKLRFRGRIVVLCHDGGSWNLLRPFINQYIIPMLQVNAKLGILDTLQPIILPYSAFAWVSSTTEGNL